MNVVQMYLAKAIEMEEQAATASTQSRKDAYLEMAVRWRNLAATVQADIEAFERSGYSYDNGPRRTLKTDLPH